MDRAEGWRVDPSPAAKKELEQKSIKEKTNQKKKKIWRQGAEQRGEFGCLVMRASTSQAHFVLFSTVGNGKSYPWKWKKGSQPAQSHHSSARRGPSAEGLPWVSALLTSAKLPASSRKKPRCTKSPLQPQNSL